MTELEKHMFRQSINMMMEHMMERNIRPICIVGIAEGAIRTYVAYPPTFQKQTIIELLGFAQKGLEENPPELIQVNKN